MELQQDSRQHRSRLGRSAALWTLVALLLPAAGCQQTPPAVETGSVPEAWWQSPPRPAEGAVPYRIDAADSELRILVYRGGPLAEFGHHHVIVAESLSGDVFLAPDFHDSAFHLRIPVAGFKVDPPAARQAEGGEFAKALSDEARAATRENMLGPDVLDAARHPRMEIRSVAVAGPGWAPDLTVRIRLRGVSREMTVPVAVIRSEDRILITGVMELKHTDFGMTPFSAMGGGLRVQDGLRIRFRLTAVKE